MTFSSNASALKIELKIQERKITFVTDIVTVLCYYVNQHKLPSSYFYFNNAAFKVTLWLPATRHSCMKTW